MSQFLSPLVLSVALSAGLLVPASAFAYLSPEQVFGGAGLTLQPAPPTQREGSDVVAARQQQSAARRTEEQKSFRSVDAAPETTKAPYTSPQPIGLFDEDQQYKLRMQRKDQASPATQVIIVGPRGEVLGSSGNVLRSSASLVTSTGPETVLAAILMVLATLSTIAYAQYRSRIVAVAL